MRRAFEVLSFAAVALFMLTAAADAQQGRVQAGVIECRGGPHVGLVLGSQNNLGCVFRSEGRPDDLYVATVTKLGLDLGITDQTAVSWVVFAPTVQLGPGDLSGNYAGVSASAAVGVGLGANALIGGSANSYALKPLRVQGQTGLNVAAGVQSLELRPGRCTGRQHTRLMKPCLFQRARLPVPPLSNSTRPRSSRCCARVMALQVSVPTSWQD